MNGKGTLTQIGGGLAELAKLQTSVSTFAGMPWLRGHREAHGGQRR